MPKCEICGQDYVMITHSHLARHDMTLEEYQTRFPHSEMRNEDYCNEDLRRRGISEGWWAKSQGERDQICKTLSEAHIGITPTDEARENLSKAIEESWRSPDTVENHLRGTKEAWKDEDFRKRFSEAQKEVWRNSLGRNLKGYLRDSSTLDEDVITLILKENFPSLWQYTGALSHMEGSLRRPDWTHTSLRKVIFYDIPAFHEEAEANIKIEEMRKLGYGCLILTDYELWVEPWILIKRVKEFLEEKE